jgi:hypothetical protein
MQCLLRFPIARRNASPSRGTSSFPNASASSSSAVATFGVPSRRVIDVTTHPWHVGHGFIRPHGRKSVTRSPTATSGRLYTLRRFELAIAWSRRHVSGRGSAGPLKVAAQPSGCHHPEPGQRATNTPEPISSRRHEWSASVAASVAQRREIGGCGGLECER